MRLIAAGAAYMSSRNVFIEVVAVRLTEAPWRWSSIKDLGKASRHRGVVRSPFPFRNATSHGLRMRHSCSLGAAVETFGARHAFLFPPLSRSSCSSHYAFDLASGSILVIFLSSDVLVPASILTTEEEEEEAQRGAAGARPLQLSPHADDERLQKKSRGFERMDGWMPYMTFLPRSTASSSRRELHNAASVGWRRRPRGHLFDGRAHAVVVQVEVEVADTVMRLRLRLLWAVAGQAGRWRRRRLRGGDDGRTPREGRGVGAAGESLPLLPGRGRRPGEAAVQAAAAAAAAGSGRSGGRKRDVEVRISRRRRRSCRRRDVFLVAHYEALETRNERRKAGLSVFARSTELGELASTGRQKLL